ncbi:DUF1853 family protein [Tamlana sp. 2201CG12-4]|uniref:DUF1853 family protein n=1 Tax=Tamlana sp. 2201CG12-4 TaxID=3112582 RepID=UPI002DBDA9AE|nr:DUF1853 family protein [Tamlana sp. 2201CG12-4]MEC3906643.1 DUF1853 family protein [Tamlana sp. 2201CG12-4]
MVNTLQKRYEGFLKTPFLWKKDVVFSLNQYETTPTPHNINISVNPKLRLGKYVEQLVSFELRQQENISIIAENIQIQQEKTTLGELDCLLLKNTTPIHLEIIYKFYLYDTSIGSTETEHFIGPNRKDALIEKLLKLKDKQLPLLYSSSCRSYLETFGLKAENIAQQVYFKAQLFVPYTNQNIQLKILNNDCVMGFYITKKELDNFTDCKFYTPIKKDWLVLPHTNVNWLTFNDFKVLSKDYVEQNFSTLFWVKLKNGIIKKAFFVWW